VILVIPCYNEAARLPVESFVEFSEENDNISFLFVNDGSTDETQQVLNGLAVRRPDHFRAMHLDRNRGKGEAVRRGVLAAIDTEPQYVGYWDADLSTPLEEIRRFVEIYERHPENVMLAGARIKMMGRRIERRTSRHYLGRVFATVASGLLDIQMYDTQCGAKLFRCKAGTRDLFAQPFHSRWLFDLELILRIQRREAAGENRPIDSLIREVPLNTWRDVPDSKISYAYFLWAFFDLLSLRLRYRD